MAQVTPHGPDHNTHWSHCVVRDTANSPSNMTRPGKWITLHGQGGSQTARTCSQNLTLILLGPGHTITHRSHKLGTNSHKRNQGHRTAGVTKHCLGHTAWPRSHFIAWVTLHSPGPITWHMSHCMAWVTRLCLSRTVYHTTSPGHTKQPGSLSLAHAPNTV